MNNRWRVAAVLGVLFCALVPFAAAAIILIYALTECFNLVAAVRNHVLVYRARVGNPKRYGLPKSRGADY
jgi:hypothetical protein